MERGFPLSGAGIQIPGPFPSHGLCSPTLNIYLFLLFLIMCVSVCERVCVCVVCVYEGVCVHQGVSVCSI